MHVESCEHDFSRHFLTKKNLSDWGSYKNISDNLMKIQT